VSLPVVVGWGSARLASKQGARRPRPTMEQRPRRWCVGSYEPTSCIAYQRMRSLEGLLDGHSALPCKALALVPDFAVLYSRECSGWLNARRGPPGPIFCRRALWTPWLSAQAQGSSWDVSRPVTTRAKPWFSNNVL